MSLYDSTGAELTESALTGHLTNVAAPPATFTLGIDVSEDFDYGDVHGDGVHNPAAHRPGRRLWRKAGSVISQTEIDDHFPVASIAGVSPATGLAAGGTAVTITGLKLGSASAVKFATTAATSFHVVDDDTITAVAPAHAAGAVTVSVTTDSGTVTSGAAAYTYT